jgi:biotin transport system substrate-specific component
MQNTLTASRNASLLRPVSDTLSGRIFLAIAASAFVGLCAHVSLPLPFTPVPLTLSNFAVLLVGLLLGPGAAFSALALYLAEGALGLPVFSPTGPGGIAHLLGPTGGFLLSYPFAAAIAGYSVRALKPALTRFANAAFACILASLVLFTLGAGWLATLLHLHLAATLKLAVLPFLPGEALKIAAAAGIFAGLERWKRS